MCPEFVRSFWGSLGGWGVPGIRPEALRGVDIRQLHASDAVCHSGSLLDLKSTVRWIQREHRDVKQSGKFNLKNLNISFYKKNGRNFFTPLRLTQCARVCVLCVLFIHLFFSLSPCPGSAYPVSFGIFSPPRHCTAH